MIKLEKDDYPKPDKCRYCGERIGWILHPMAEMLALHLCDKPECQKKAKGKKKPRNEN